jgi:tetratricopeptide (TPR) repeat protein
VLLAVWGQTVAARAETCPEVPDEEVALRRSMAKEWFAKAEESEAAGDRQAAVRRYACSLSLAPHPSTAYNLGTVAEKSGDLSMAVDGFRTYLKLAPEATDRPAIEARIITLEAKVSEARKIAPKPPAPETPPALAAAPPPAVVVVQAPPSDDGGAHTRRVLAWTSAGAALAALGGGVVFNVIARGKMSDCFRDYGTRPAQALDLCDDAKPLAYGSYALFGAAGALGVTSAILFLTSGGRSPEGTSNVALAPSVNVGGASLIATGRF